MQHDSLINMDYLNRLSMGDDTLVVEMIEMFLDNAPEMLENLHTHLNNENWTKMAAEAHRFKPTLSYMGMEQTKKVIENLEKIAADDPDVRDMEEKLNEIETMCNRAYNELKNKVEELKTS